MRPFDLMMARFGEGASKQFGNRMYEAAALTPEQLRAATPTSEQMRGATLKGLENGAEKSMIRILDATTADEQAVAKVLKDFSDTGAGRFADIMAHHALKELPTPGNPPTGGTADPADPGTQPPTGGTADPADPGTQPPTGGTADPADPANGTRRRRGNGNGGAPTGPTP